MIQCNNLEVALPKIAWKIILRTRSDFEKHLTIKNCDKTFLKIILRKISQSKNTRMTHLIFIFEVMIFSVLNYDKQQ